MNALKKKERPLLKDKTKDTLFASCIVVPILIYFTIFYFLPAIMNIYYMFCDYNFIKDPEFVGLKHIKRMFSDPIARKALWNTLKITVFHVPAVIFLSMVAAGWLYHVKKGAAFFRGAIFATYLTSMAVVALLFKNLFGNEVGVVNGLLVKLGFEKQKFMTNPDSAMAIVIAAQVWKSIGYNTVIYLAGYSNINKDLYDAAMMDRAGHAAIFWHITIPQLLPTIVFTSIVGIIGALRSYGMVVALTNGGPYNSTQTLMMYIFDQGFKARNVGYSSTLSFALMAIILVITLIQMKLSNSYNSDAEV